MKRMSWFVIVMMIAFTCACGTPPNPSGDPDGGNEIDSNVPMEDAIVPPTDDGMPPVDSGPPGCSSDADCNDDVNCTADSCVTTSGTCRHIVTPALCATGESCNPMTGCEMGRACATNADCEDTDACTSNERCDPAARVCTFQPLDGDLDGDPPRVCGGGDCDDSRGDVSSVADERCDNIDNDCDSVIDDGATLACGALEVCVSGSCECGPGAGACGGSTTCHDLATDPANCGACASSCGTGTCTAGTCTCGAGLTSCRGIAPSTACDCMPITTYPMVRCMIGSSRCGGCIGFEDFCDDLLSCQSECTREFMCVGGNVMLGTTLIANCTACTGPCPGICDFVCPPGGTSSGSFCTDATTDRQNCGACGNVCASDMTCVSGACVCPAGQTRCGSTCVTTATNPSNCGACGNVCASGTTCVSGACTCSIVGQTLCGGACVDTLIDAGNCGMCGRTCGAGAYCEGGACIMCGTENAQCCPTGPSCTAAGNVCIGLSSLVSNNKCRRTAACDVLAQTGCLSGEACYAAFGSGTTYCAMPGTGGYATSCYYDTDCAAGLGCNLMAGNRCYPY